MKYVLDVIDSEAPGELGQIEFNLTEADMQKLIKTAKLVKEHDLLSANVALDDYRALDDGEESSYRVDCADVVVYGGGYARPRLGGKYCGCFYECDEFQLNGSTS